MLEALNRKSSQQAEPLEWLAGFITLQRCRRDRRRLHVHVVFAPLAARRPLLFQPIERLDQFYLVVYSADNEVRVGLVRFAERDGRRDSSVCDLDLSVRLR